MNRGRPPGRYEKLTIALFVVIAWAGCYDDVITYADPLWCGDKPCFWTVDEGEVERGATWHAQDSALVLISEHVRLSRVVTPEGDVRCTGISALGDTGSASLFFEMDQGDDFSVEHSLSVVAYRFERVVLAVNPDRFRMGQPVRFILRKEGRSAPRLADLRLVCGPVTR